MKLKRILLPFIALISAQTLFAGEGMWLPYLLEKINASEMQRMGLKISAEDIYSTNKACLKDAIVMFGRGCTGEIVSDKGLVLTNHHCGYGEIQNHSSIDHDYLTNGFWASDYQFELPNPGLAVRILTEMQDVSAEVLSAINSDMDENTRKKIISDNIASLTKKQNPDKFNEVLIKAFYYGNQYIMMKYKVFYDVRLVGAPPSNIGKFGGDTDNWMWPRHTGDFSVFRIYANKENQPADYNKDNQPYQAKYVLEISLKGVEKGDFTMVFGYPGTTQEYLPSDALELITQKLNPFAISTRTLRLDIMREFMEKDAGIRIQYSAKYAGVANGWKKWQGESNGIKRLNGIEKKQDFEKEFNLWASKNAPQYTNLLASYSDIYKQLQDWRMATAYYSEAGYSIELVSFASAWFAIIDSALVDKPDTAFIAKQKRNLFKSIDEFYKDYSFVVDKKLFIALLKTYKSIPYKTAPIPDIFNFIDKKFKGNIEDYADFVYKKSVFPSQKLMMILLENFDKKAAKQLDKDPMMVLAASIINNFTMNIRPTYLSLTAQLDSFQRVYMKAQMEMKADNRWYPDANSTLRIAYGKVDTYFPRDGVEYKYYTTLDGIMEKENPGIYDYVVEPKLKDLYKRKDFGPYKDKDGSLHTCFIASNHTTGGNSGSPVLNANGQLIGINFDRDWEGTMSDLMYDPDQCRNIALDIRYCLFIIDKYAEAKRLIKEMKVDIK